MASLTTTPSVYLRLSMYVIVYRFCEHTWAPQLIKKCFRIAIEWWNHTHPYQTWCLSTSTLPGFFSSTVSFISSYDVSKVTFTTLSSLSILFSTRLPRRRESASFLTRCFIANNTFNDSEPTKDKLAKNGECYIMLQNEKFKCFQSMCLKCMSFKPSFFAKCFVDVLAWFFLSWHCNQCSTMKLFGDQFYICNNYSCHCSKKLYKFRFRSYIHCSFLTHTTSDFFAKSYYKLD